MGTRFPRLILVLAPLLACAAVPAQAVRPIWICGEGPAAVARLADTGHACRAFVAPSWHERAAGGDDAALLELLAVMREPMLLMPEKMQAVSVLDYPKGRRPSAATLVALEETLADPRLPFRAAVGLAEFMHRFEPLPAPPERLVKGLSRRLIKSETCGVAARMLAGLGDPGLNALYRTWLRHRQSADVLDCLNYEIERHLERLLPKIVASFDAATDDRELRLHLVNWMGAIGEPARAALEHAAADADSAIARIARGYLENLERKAR